MSTASYTQFYPRRTYRSTPRVVAAPREPSEWEVQVANMKPVAARLDVLAADCRRHGMDAVLPTRLDPENREASEIREWIADAETALELVESDLSKHLTGQALASVRAAGDRKLKRAAHAKAHEPERRDRIEEIDQAIEEYLSPRVRENELAELLAGIDELPAETWKDELRSRIKKANERADRIAADRSEAARLLPELDEFRRPERADEALDAVLVELGDAVSGSEFAPDLRQRAESILERLENAAAAEELPRHLESVLEELGYRVDPAAPGMTSGRRLWDITHPDWPEHAVKATVDSDGLFHSEVLRTNGGEEDSKADEERGWEWCNTVQRARDRVSEAGFDSEQTDVVAPGSEPVRRAATRRRRDEEQRRRRQQ